MNSLLKRLCKDALCAGVVSAASLCSVVVDAHAALFPSPKELRRRARIERRRTRRAGGDLGSSDSKR